MSKYRGQPLLKITFTHITKEWEFPNSRFITYEPQDEPMCRRLGLGREVERTVQTVIPHAFMIGKEIHAYCIDNGTSIKVAEVGYE